MVRELAGWQEDRYASVAAWSLREALLAYLELLKRMARERYERECDRYMHDRKLPKEPVMPDILRADEPTIERTINDG